MLTEAKCRAAKPAAKAYKLADSRGLFLFVSTSGFKGWRWKFRVAGREKTLTLGAYPETSLAEAREARAEAAKAHRAGKDPAQERRQRLAAEAQASSETFEAIARAWHERQKSTWAPRHAAHVLKTLEDEAFPSLGSRPIRSITPRQVLETLRKVEARGAVDRAHRLRQRISAVFVSAIAAELADFDPAASVGKALRPVRIGNYPALTTLEDARALILASESTPGHPLTKLAARLLALTATRSGPLRHAEPHEFEGLDTKAPIWRIPAAKMKLELADKLKGSQFDFIVPLAPASVEIVKIAIEMNRGGPLLFPSWRHAHRPMSDATLSAMYRRLAGWQGRHVPHGWRSTFSTIMNELAEREGRAGDRAIIDLMLAHKPSGVEAVYNRAAFMPRRREIAERWAQLLLEGLPPSSSLLDIRRN